MWNQQKSGVTRAMVADRQHVLLADHTTLRLGGPARDFVAAATESAVVASVRAADRAGEPLLVLGGGSNLVIADAGFPGTVVQVATRGLGVADTDGSVTVDVAAGEGGDPWPGRCDPDPERGCLRPGGRRNHHHGAGL
jgi:UDP-N-acetylmuramate dehydrogenase